MFFRKKNILTKNLIYSPCGWGVKMLKKRISIRSMFVSIKIFSHFKTPIKKKYQIQFHEFESPFFVKNFSYFDFTYLCQKFCY